MANECAFITGAASGIGLAIARFLFEKGISVFLADLNEAGLRSASQELDNAPYAVVDVSDWDSQVKAFKDAVSKLGGRVDYVFPNAGIGENTWLRSLQPDQGPDDFAKPDLRIININTIGFLYTTALAVQQFRRQGVGKNGFRGKLINPGSIMGIYPSANNPLYNLSKHAVTSITRSLGLSLPAEKITVNAYSPSSIETGFSKDEYYRQLEGEGLLTPMAGVLEVVDITIGTSNISGQCFEIGPNYEKVGLVKPKFPEHVDRETARVFDIINARGNAK